MEPEVILYFKMTLPRGEFLSPDTNAFLVDIEEEEGLILIGVDMGNKINKGETN